MIKIIIRGIHPKKVLKTLNKERGWDRQKKQNEWLDKAVVDSRGSYEVITFPDGKEVWVAVPASCIYTPYTDPDDYLEYYYGPTVVGDISTI